MDDRRFDALARVFAAPTPRRAAIRTVAGGALGVLGALWGVRAATACGVVDGACDADRPCCAGSVCRAGRCVCRRGLTACGAGGCRNLNNDAANCGRCGRTCSGGRLCCGGRCVNPRSHPRHCGRCDRVCAADETCVAGTCASPPPPPPPGICARGADSCAGTNVSCGATSSCQCWTTTEGTTRCGAPTALGGFCGECAGSADCARFGEGAFCVSTTNSRCCGPHANNFCQLPCPD